jgi:hypothetical protein
MTNWFGFSGLRALIVVLAFVVAGCEAAPLPEPLAELTYTGLPAISLDVAVIEVVELYQPPLRAPNVDHDFPTSPARAMRQWVKDRLRAVGETGTARFIIQDAAVTETKLEKREGLSGLFYKEQSERYDGRLEIILEIRDERGFREAFATGMAEQFNTAAEGISLDERERLFHALASSLVDIAGAELEKNIAQFLGPYLR